MTGRRLVEESSLLRELMDAIPDGIIVKDKEANWLMANRAALEFYGIREVFCPGMSSGDVALHSEVYASLVQTFRSHLDAVWQHKKPSQRRDWITVREGRRCFEVSRIPTYHPDGSPNVMLVLYRDITAQVHGETLMVQSEKLSLAGQLAAGVAHEIRNPLTVIMGFLQLLEAESSSPYIPLMRSEANRMQSILNEFLLLARPVETVLVKVDMMTLLQEVVALLSPQAVLRAVEINVNASHSLPQVLADSNRLKQVFINLLKNAVDAMPHGGVVRLLADTKQQDVRVRVIDDGVGVAESELKRLGEPFYTTKSDGTGLGLMVCQRIVQGHGGSLTIHSEEGQGTEVEVLLPALKD